jgi:hypothetical protein
MCCTSCNTNRFGFLVFYSSGGMKNHAALLAVAACLLECG